MFKITKKCFHHNNEVLFIRIQDDFKQGGEKQLVRSQLDQPFSQMYTESKLNFPIAINIDGWILFADYL